MKKLLATLLSLHICIITAATTIQSEPATVIITAGQSNTDGRVPNSLLPDYIKANGYNHCLWSYGSDGKLQTSGFEPFFPRIAWADSEKWAYDAVTYYLLDKSLDSDFYVIKWSLGGTAIDPSCELSTQQKYWSADSAWLANNKSTLRGGKSLLLSFTEQIDSCIDNHLSRLPQGYEIKAFLWHQGESDFSAPENYRENLRNVVRHVRNHLVMKTGNQAYAKLPFIFGTVARSNIRFTAEIDNAMRQLTNEDPNFFLIDTSDYQLQDDKLHFTAEAAERLGREMYNRLVDLGIAGHP